MILFFRVCPQFIMSMDAYNIIRREKDVTRKKTNTNKKNKNEKKRKKKKRIQKGEDGRREDPVLAYLFYFT